MIITKAQYKTSKWSGGATTELFIYPSESSYQDRNFKIRISSATVLVDESEFTKLPDYNRVLMILSGELEICHAEQYETKLTQYSCDSFDGAWNTTAKGKVIDFNLMIAKSLKGELEYEMLALNSEIKSIFNPNLKLSAIYLISGKLISKSYNYQVNPGDLIILKNELDANDLQVAEDSKIIRIKVSS